MKESDIVTMTVAEYEAMKKKADQVNAPIVWIPKVDKGERLYLYISQCGNYILAGDYGYAKYSAYSTSVEWYLHDVRKGTKTPCNK